jgi:septum formation protein
MPPVFSLTTPFILASQSPRRRRLLNQLDLAFSVEVSPADERLDTDPSPKQRARQLAARKADPVAETHPIALVLAADTIVIHEDTVLEKPETPDEARQMLRRLSGTTHTVYTGVALQHVESDRQVTAGRATEVTFRNLSSGEINAYVATGSPMDKAGAYGIQDHTGPLLVANLHGDYYSVVGLPLEVLYSTLQSHFGDLMTVPNAS